MASGLSTHPILFTLIGAAVSWGKLGREKLRIFYLSDVLDLFFKNKENWFRRVLELVIFITMGCLISAGIVDPTTPIQALTAGLSWTGILTTASRK